MCLLTLSIPHPLFPSRHTHIHTYKHTHTLSLSHIHTYKHTQSHTLSLNIEHELHLQINIWGNLSLQFKTLKWVWKNILREWFILSCRIETIIKNEKYKFIFRNSLKRKGSLLNKIFEVETWSEHFSMMIWPKNNTLTKTFQH